MTQLAKTWRGLSADEKRKWKYLAKEQNAKRMS
jgi:hypothetical protein